MIDLEEARDIANRLLVGLGYGDNLVEAVVVLDNRITELEIKVEEKKRICKRWRDRYDNLTSLIHKAIITEENQEWEYPENELKKLIDRIAELEAQREELTARRAKEK